MSKDFPEQYEFNGVTYNIDWTDYKSLDLFIKHLNQSVTNIEMDLWDTSDSIVDFSDDYPEAKEMLRNIGVKV